SMAWAATAGLAVAGSWLAAATAIVALGILGLARVFRPERRGGRRRAKKPSRATPLVVGAPGIN
ncbi:MAG TPA: hypothetical protein PKA74_19125, partial [Bauldia sp.]|nr:hypothetical protein [Bauldia sp.]